MITDACTRRVEWSEDLQFYAYPPGSMAQGHPLPYIIEEGGHKYLMVGTMWTSRRLDEYSDWCARVQEIIRRLLGGDDALLVYAKALVAAARPKIDGPVDVKALMNPTFTEQEEQAAVEFAKHLETVRERISRYATRIYDMDKRIRALAANKRVTDFLAEQELIRPWTFT